MTAKRFRFVSPGVKINEIDRSVLTANNGAIGPVVVGRFQRGPGMVPVTVESYIDFDNAFGPPTRGVVNSTRSDVWRTGQLQSPTYAAYAAEAWLKNSSPLTAVRLLGVEHPQKETATDDASAGWVAGSGEAATQGGAWGIFVAPSGSNVTGALAAVIYLATGSVELVGTGLSGSSMVSGTNVFVKSTGDDFEFRIRILDGATTKVDTAFNLNKASAKHIRKVLNTNPVLTNDEVNPAAIVKNYWLGETFETFVRDTIGTGSAVATGQVMASIVALENADANLGDHLGVQAQPAKTGWVIAQDLDAVTGSFDPSMLPKLFRFSTLGGEDGDSSGEWEQKNVKVSIEDIKPSNSSFNKYGSFTVKVRKLYDSDKRQEVLETFTNCNLDPTSPNFIAKLIGDKVTMWDEDDQKHRTIGNFDNNSNFIRVEVDTLLEQGALDAQLLPFGFFGPPQLVSAKLAAGTNSETDALFSGSTNAVTCELLFPAIPMVATGSSQRGSSTHFGINCSLGANGVFNEDVLDLLRAKPAAFNSYEFEAGATGIQNSVVFTLDDVSGSTESDTLAVWAEGSRAAGNSLTAISASATGSNEGYRNVLNAGFNRFTMPLFGGTDGVRITEKDPFRNSFLDNAASSDVEGKTNYALYSLRRAIATVADPETLDMNLMTIPGVTNEKVTNRVIEVCESRADALAIIDVAGGYVPDADTNLVEKDNLQERLGSVSTTINNVKSRDFNSSYACAYYPWVKIKDQREAGDLWVPPSVVALGTMASSQEVSAVWFAPAGFNRGGLDRGSAGLTVTDVREVLKATQRDDLYEVNINPIARFPAEGIVIFGQKTLQATPSALDRINVRRLVLFLKKQISGIASGLLFDQNIKTTWQRFLNQVNPLMESTKSGGGIVDYKVVLDETTTTPDLIDRNTMYAKIFIKPAYAIEFIGIDFVITNSGASFDDL
jgi:hypothetical protein